MNLVERALDPPRYGFERDGKLYIPTPRELWREFFRKLNVFADRKNWLPLWGWVATLSFAYPLWIFVSRYLSFPLVVVGFIYSMVLMGSHGTFWLHRYSTHRAYRFRSPWIREICRNLVIKVIPEETYVVSHYVHHLISEKPGDPYNVHAGWLYCFLADVTHQGIRKDLSESEYAALCGLMKHTGVKLNTYTQYQRWGSLCHPLKTVLHYVLNWAFWFTAFYWIGGPALAYAIFGAAGVWAVGIRTFNFEGHGKGRDLRQDGIDFNRRDLSVNQIWPGYVAGEWHNNHHLYPSGARSGFLPYQIDLPWYFVRFLSAIGAISHYLDFKKDFIRDHLEPYRARLKAEAEAGAEAKLDIDAATIPV